MDEHGKNQLKCDGEVYPYGGIGNLKNGVLLNFLKNKYKRILITFDLDVEEDIEPTLKSLGLKKSTHYFPIGLNEAGRRSIEGLVPEEIKKVVHSSNTALVEQAMNGTAKEKTSAKNTLKKKILEEFKKQAKPGNEYFKHFYEVAKTINKAMGS